MAAHDRLNKLYPHHPSNHPNGTIWITYTDDSAVLDFRQHQYPNHSQHDLYNDEQIDEANYIFACLWVCMLILCTFGNALNLTVLLRSLKSWKMSACHYMIATAVSDLASLWLTLPYLLQLITRGRITHTPSIAFGIVPWLVETSMWLSDWILVVFSWERLLVILSPLRFRWLQRVSVAHIAILVLLILSLLFNMIDFVVNYADPHIQSYGARYGIDADKSVGWIHQWLSVHATAKVAMRLLTFLLVLIPTFGLIGFLAYYRQSEISKMRVIPNARKESCASTTRSAHNSINVILLSSAALFLLMRAPQTFQICVLAGNRTVSLYNADNSVTVITDDFINLGSLAGYTFNFYVYLMTERHYRKRFTDVVVRPLLSCCTTTLPLPDKETCQVEESNAVNSSTSV
ncbi:uncharacterized protein LOC129592787 [Paramacrobiotus metropolitanus]|uniref:uncharacterized protein LOC129592787 n=1 Tax=Paramacrobiotus metropolitanus TaxID=2943436 RepID=UPI002445ED2A|nr:uncharacterized protein LOC129592787 [Paramacrobiotus metropolitanus]